MAKMIVTGAYCVQNKGDAALRLGGLPSLKKQIPDADFTIASLFPEIDSKIYKDWKVIKAIDSPAKAIDSVIRCSLWNILSSYLGLKTGITHKLIDTEVLRDYAKSDMILDISGDSISEVTGFYGTAYHLLHVWMGLALKKPTIIYAQSVGPFKYTKLFAKYLLNNVDLITLRGKVSYDYLKEIGVNEPPMYLTADLAFLMEPAPEARIEEILSEYNKLDRTPMVGISVSNLITKYYGSYQEFVELMANVTDYIAKDLKASVVFIPHVTGPKKENDDRLVAEDIFNLCTYKDKIFCITDDNTPQEMKGIIGRCDLFIGARMHACIGALSMCVPTINISYHHKSNEIMAMFGLEENVISGTRLTYDNIISRIDDTWTKRITIKEDLGSKLETVKEQAMINSKILREFLDHKSSFMN